MADRNTVTINIARDDADLWELSRIAARVRGVSLSSYVADLMLIAYEAAGVNVHAAAAMARDKASAIDPLSGKGGR